jgi:hypothetical protein
LVPFSFSLTVSLRYVSLRQAYVRRDETNLPIPPSRYVFLEASNHFGRYWSCCNGALVEVSCLARCAVVYNTTFALPVQLLSPLSILHRSIHRRMVRELKLIPDTCMVSPSYVAFPSPSPRRPCDCCRGLCQATPLAARTVVPCSCIQLPDGPFDSGFSCYCTKKLQSIWRYIPSSISATASRHMICCCTLGRA